jgi:hypothetical protein
MSIVLIQFEYRSNTNWILFNTIWVLFQYKCGFCFNINSSGDCLKP